MWEAYERVREKMGHHLRRQKEIYDRKAHGRLYNKGDKVWLFNAAVPKGTVHPGNFINLGQDPIR